MLGHRSGWSVWDCEIEEGLLGGFGGVVIGDLKVKKKSTAPEHALGRQARLAAHHQREV